MGYLPEFTTVFVPVRECVKKVIDSMDIKLGEFFGETGPNPLKMHNRRGKVLAELVFRRLGHLPFPVAVMKMIGEPAGISRKSR
jgi:hypothetical protein